MRGKTAAIIENGCFMMNSSQVINLYNIKRIHRNAFYNCYGLQSLNIYDSSVSINDCGRWLFGGVDPITINKDEKRQYRKITLQVNGDSADAVMLTNSNGYIMKPIAKDKVRLITVSNDYAADSRWNTLTGMTNDSDRLATLLKDFTGNITKLKNSAATRQAVINAITEAVSEMQEDELLIFHDSGHGGSKGVDSNTGGYISYMCLYNHTILYDYEFWNLIKNAKCRIMAIFCTCYSGTMYAAPALDQYGSALMRQSHLQIKQQSWASSARQFFVDCVRPTSATVFAASADSSSSIDEIAASTDDISPRLCVFSACADDEVSYMTNNVGHDFMTSIISNFKRNDMMDSYTSLFANATTEHEPSRLNNEGGNPDNLNPEMYTDLDFDDSIRAFT